MEIIDPNLHHGNVRVAIFDFDGTLSLLRESWTDIMLSLMLDALMLTPQHEDETTLRGFISNLIYQTAGQQTIYQMIRLAQEAKKRGGNGVSSGTSRQPGCVGYDSTDRGDWHGIAGPSAGSKSFDQRINSATRFLGETWSLC